MNIGNMKISKVLKEISGKTRRKNAIIKMDMEKKFSYIN